MERKDIRTRPYRKRKRITDDDDDDDDEEEHEEETPSHLIITRLPHEPSSSRSCLVEDLLPLEMIFLIMNHLPFKDWATLKMLSRIWNSWVENHPRMCYMCKSPVLPNKHRCMIYSYPIAPDEKGEYQAIETVQRLCYHKMHITFNILRIPSNSDSHIIRICNGCRAFYTFWYKKRNPYYSIDLAQGDSEFYEENDIIAWKDLIRFMNHYTLHSRVISRTIIAQKYLFNNIANEAMVKEEIHRTYPSIEDIYEDDDLAFNNNTWMEHRYEIKEGHHHSLFDK